MAPDFTYLLSLMSQEVSETQGDLVFFKISAKQLPIRRLYVRGHRIFKEETVSIPSPKVQDYFGDT